MTTRILLALAILLSVAACKIGGGETNEGAAAACVDVGTACASNADCCSYGCVGGLCAANPTEGGTCRTTDDCILGRLCKSGACTTELAGMCRDTGDVCTVGYSSSAIWGDCCGGNCEAGTCTANRAPTADAGPDVPDAPYTRLFTLANQSADPDLDPLSYGWTLASRPAGSTAVLSSQTAAAPTFTPDRVGAYVVRLVVTEGPSGAPDRHVLEDEVVITAVNRAPVATVGTPGAAAAWSRNVPITLTGAVSDPDGDLLSCGWRVTAPGETAPTEATAFAGCDNPSAPTYSFTPVGEGTYLVELVVRDYDRTATTQVVNTTVASASFVSVNDAPVPVVTRTAYYANLGATAETTPPVTLDASPSTDPNGDDVVAPYLSFFWEMVSAADGGALPVLADEDSATPSFTPDRATTYVLQVTVSDAAQFGRGSASSEPLQVSVEVGRHVRPLGHTVADSARATAAGKIVLAGKDPADPTKGMIWVYDMATGTEGAGIRLSDPGDGSSALPRLVDVTPNGTKAVVVDDTASIWIVTFGTTPSIRRVPQPFSVAQCLVAGDKVAFLFTTGGTDYMRELDLTTGAITQPAGAGYSFGGAAANGAATLLYRVTQYDWYRYTVNNSGGLSQTAWSSTIPSCGGYPAQPASIWGTLDGSYVVSSCGQVYNGSTLGALPTSLAVSPSFVDSASDGGLLVTGSTSLQRYGSTLALQGTDTLPKWAEDGYGRTAFASKAFFDDGGTKRIAVVRDTATPTRYGIVTFP